MKSKILGLLTVSLMAGSLAANAAPIAVDAGQSHIFNFNFAASGAVPAPPYDSLRFETGRGGLNADQVGFWELFSDLNATGTVFANGSHYLRSITDSNSYWNDGIFSARVSMSSGWMRFDPFAYGVAAGVQTPNVAPTGAWVTIKASTSAQIIEALWTASRTGTPTTIKVAPGHYTFVQSFDTGVGPSVLPPVKSTVFVVGTAIGSTILDAFGADGRIFTVKSGGSLVVRNMTLTHGGFGADDVSVGGGVAASFGGSLRVDDCLLIANGTGAEDGALGGAVLSKDGRLHLERVTIMNNAVDGCGGGVAVVGGSGGIIRDSIISGNEARSQGSMCGGGVYVDEATVTITGSTVSGNRAERRGGGILNAGTIWLTDSAVTENAASDPGHFSYGGGIANFGLMRIKNVTVAANSAGTFGGGIFNQGRLFSRGATIVRNEVYGDVGLSGCDPELEPCFGGGGVWNAEGGTVSSARSIFANNSIPVYEPLPPLNLVVSVGPDCAGPTLSEGFNALGDVSGCDLRPSYVLQGQPTHDLVGVDPGLGDLRDNGVAGNAHFPLLGQSPLIDAGGRISNYCTTFDQIGQPRVDGDGDRLRECDIGAIEYQLP